MAKILFKNGRIWDGENFFYADLLTDGDKIAKIEKSIKDTADYTFNVKGKTVSAGLVDIHAHLKGISCDQYGVGADICTLPFGVTFVSDASAEDIGNKQILETFTVKNNVFVCTSVKDDTVTFEKTKKLLELYGDKAIGVKVFFDVNATGVKTTAPLKEIVSFAEKRNLKVLVHSTGTPLPMAEVLSVLRSGDILTHAYHGGSNPASDDNFKSIKEAKSRGVIIDAGLAGYVHTNFKVFKEAIEKGALPNVISTDITKSSAFKRGSKYGLPTCMSIARFLGIGEANIFKAVTSSAAKAVNHDGGYLKVGGIADIAVLEFTDEGFDMTDYGGNHIKTKKGYRNIITVLNGEIVYRR